MLASVLAAISACDAEPPKDDPLLEYREADDERSPEMCAPPPELDEVPREVLNRPPSPPAPVAEGAWSRGGHLRFDLPAAREVVTIYEYIDEEDDADESSRGRTWSREVGGQRITLVPRGTTPPRPSDNQTIIVIPDRDVADYQIAMEVAVLPDTGQVWFDDIRVETPEGVAVGHAADVGYASEPLSCGEQALVRFGPLPAGMPSFHWPINKACTGTKCLQVRTAYVEAVHDTWRLTQMADGVHNLPSYSRSWAWDQPAANAEGLSAGVRTSLRYYFGSYKPDRLDTVRDLFRDHLNVLRSGRMDGIKLRLKCPEQSTHGGNGCFSRDSWAHHAVKGWVNICPRTWSGLDTMFANDEEGWLDWFNHTVAHEFYHHHWAKIDGVGHRMLQDAITHKHGNSCTKSSTNWMISEPAGDPYDKDVRHLAGWNNSQGEHCGHRRMALRNLDQYNTASRVIGDRIRSGEAVWWPLIEPTPQPPTCVGGENCLCENADPQYDAPDGDYSDEHFCSDNGATLECMTRAFGAGNPVGICTDCDTVRGPGCECRDGLVDCDVGSCYGDDTNGADMAWGKCFVDPPSHDCLVDCEALLGSGAFCMWNHPDWARCVTAGTGLPDAGGCWLDGGHHDMNGDCTMAHECGPGAPPHNGISQPDCQDLGYPPYFQCDNGTHRCVVDL